jgi:FkbM family methyltransferase
MKTSLQRWLAAHPALYRRLWRALGRGSVEKRVFLCLVRRGDVVCDVGANRGYFTRLFSDIVGPEGKVHAFEPGPDAVEMLRAGLQEARGHDNVSVTEAAVGEVAGTAGLLVPGEAEGQASLRRQQAGEWLRAPEVRRHECRVVTLDGATREFTRLDFVKCDIEGAELDALRGARETLRRFMPLVFAEVYHEWMRPFGHKPEDLVAFMRGLGYDDFRVVADRVGPLEGADFSQSVNLLCARRDVHAARLATLAQLWPWD